MVNRVVLPGILILMSICTPAVGQQFRIETEVYREGIEKPISENLTLFHDNMIYDFMLRTDKTRFPKEIVIYVVDQKRFVLIDIDREFKTEIIEKDVIQIITAMQRSGIEKETKAFFFDPSFKEEFDISSGWLTLSSEPMTYRAKGQRPREERVLTTYFDFINQFARLNATDPRRMPPFPRLQLNEAIKKYGFVPEQVEVTLDGEALEMPETIRLKTNHVMTAELSDTDHERIESAKRYWQDFENVTLSEFRQFETSDETNE